MKVSIKGGGGFAGTAEHYEIDTARVAQGEAIEALLQDLDFFAAPVPPAPVGADIPHWEITVDDGRQCRTVSFAEDGGPACAQWKPVIERVRGGA
ncbi:MAG TPA: protealysin inhibitor emfourin [Telluria sp.]